MTLTYTNGLSTPQPIYIHWLFTPIVYTLQNILNPSNPNPSNPNQNFWILTFTNEVYRDPNTYQWVLYTLTNLYQPLTYPKSLYFTNLTYKIIKVNCATTGFKFKSKLLDKDYQGSTTSLGLPVYHYQSNTTSPTPLVLLY